MLDKGLFEIGLVFFIDDLDRLIPAKAAICLAIQSPRLALVGYGGARSTAQACSCSLSRPEPASKVSNSS